MIDLEAYAADCRLFGRVDLGDGRLTDLLNVSAELVVQDARLESLVDGHVTESPELVVARDELYAVVASGSRGDVARRVRTHTTRVEVDLGPYRVAGLVHGTPASDPLGIALRRASWMPLTDATVVYRRGEDTVGDDVPTLLVNRDLATSIRAVEEPDVVLPWEAPRAARPAASRAFELTGELRDDEHSDDGAATPSKEPGSIA